MENNKNKYVFCLNNGNLFLYSNCEEDIITFFAVEIMKAKEPHHLAYVLDYEQVIYQLNCGNWTLYKLYTNVDNEELQEVISSLDPGDIINYNMEDGTAEKLNCLCNPPKMEELTNELLDQLINLRLNKRGKRG